MDLAGRLRPTSRSLKKALRLLKHWIFSNRDVETVGLVKFQQCYKWASLALEASYPLSALAGFTRRIPQMSPKLATTPTSRPDGFAVYII